MWWAIESMLIYNLPHSRYASSNEAILLRRLNSEYPEHHMPRTLVETPAWQWSLYSEAHRDRANLQLHIVAVPVFEVGVVVAVVAALLGAWWTALAGVLAAAASMIAQGRGHRRERNFEPFEGPQDFLARLFIEQFYNFPRFVLTGGWWRNLRQAH